MSVFKKIGGWFTTPGTRPVAYYVGSGLFVGVVGFLIFHFFMMKGSTNSTEFCISCHEMEGVYKEYTESTHYKNPSGVRAECADCHIPHGNTIGDYYDKLMDKIFVGGRHLYHHLIKTYPNQEAFEKSRYRLAEIVWDTMRKRDSKECRQCHSYTAMAMLDQGKSASRKHSKMMKDGTKTCSDCHTGLTHEEPEEPDEEEEEE